MIITDFNKMSLEDLEVIHYNLGMSFEINDGKIVGEVNEGHER
jgi:hypothetical protein